MDFVCLQERALLYAAAGEHKKVLDVYVYDLADMKAASRYCSEVSEYGNVGMEPLSLLLTMLFRPDTERMPSSHTTQSFRDVGLDILAQNVDTNAPVHVCVHCHLHYNMCMLSLTASYVDVRYCNYCLEIFLWNGYNQY